MTTDNKVTEIYCLADDFCKYFSSLIKNRQIDSDRSVRRRNRKSTMSDAEVITILILFHMQGYRCLNHFYLDYVCKNNFGVVAKTEQMQTSSYKLTQLVELTLISSNSR